MKKIQIKTGFSQNRNEKEAVKEVFNQINQENMSFVIMFSDGDYDQLKINKAWKEVIPKNVPFLGSASTRINIPSFNVGKNISPVGFKKGLVAMSISSEKIKATVRLIKDIRDNWEKNSKDVLNDAAKEIDLDFNNFDQERYFGILLSDTTSSTEDLILENFYAQSGLNFVGGGSMGRMNLIDFIFITKEGALPGYVHTKEGVFNDAAVVALVKCDIPFKIIFTTNFFATSTKFEVTKAEGFYIHELNGKPAAEEYARALGVSKYTIGLTYRLPNIGFNANHPLGLMIGNRAYIRFVATREGNSLRMASRVKEGQTLYLMERGAIVKTTKEAMDKLKDELKSISGMILFHCNLRTLEANKLKLRNELFNVMNIAPLIGACTFREYYGWLAMENSLVILAFGDR